MGKATLIGGSGASAGALKTLTLDVKDSTVGNDTGDAVTVERAGTCSKITGNLRLPITADLTVRFRLVLHDGTGLWTLATCTIPHTRAVRDVMTFTTFSGTTSLPADASFLCDVLASDGQKDGAGIATFKVYY